MWHKKKNSDNEELIVTNDAVERKLPDNNEKEQPDFAEEKDVSEVEQELLDYMNEDQEEKETVCPLDEKTEADRGRQHAPSSVYYKPNCMRGK